MPGGHFGGVEFLSLPENSCEYDVFLAAQAQALCSAQGMVPARHLLETAGFEVLKQVHYDKPASDISHTCAWTLGKKQVVRNGESRTLLLVTIRGTSGGEWISNFDIAPSRDDDTGYAENFLACAEDVLSGLREVLDSEENPLLLICGHSRGAACANLLGLLLDEERGPEDIYVYTFATPTTARGEVLERDCPNIFNLINPCDLVPMLPPDAMGYGRVGQDIILFNDKDAAAALSNSVKALNLAPTITAYYTDRHSLSGPGLSDDGLTTFEFLCATAGAFTGSGTGISASEISPDSDFAPLLGLLSGSGDTGNTKVIGVVMQHLPVTYLALILASSVFN